MEVGATLHAVNEGLHPGQLVWPLHVTAFKPLNSMHICSCPSLFFIRAAGVPDNVCTAPLGVPSKAELLE